MRKWYYIVHKPYGYLSQFSGEPNDLTLADLIRDNGISTFPKTIYSVGRLDKDSEGLLLLTNDNPLKTKLLDPKAKHTKTYWVQVEGIPAEETLQPLRAGGVEIVHEGKKHRCLPADVHLLTTVPLEERNPPIRVRKNIPTSWLEITLIEGKNRQVRKMTAAIGFPTLRLVRTGIGKLKLADLPKLTLGKIMELSPEQLRQLTSFSR